MGRTDVARALVIPSVVAGVLLLILSGGLVAGNLARIASFPDAYASDPATFVASEIGRVDDVASQYAIAMFRVIPLIVLVCAVLVAVMHGPVGRAWFVTTIAMLSLVMLVDTNANARLEDYKEKLLLARSNQ